MKDQNHVYITTAISYVNAKPHIGHAIEMIYADVLARFYRAKGREVKFVTGTDEHGQKIATKATEAGKTPQAYADEFSGWFEKMAEVLNISQDFFVRTTTEQHRRAAQEFWKRTRDAGYIYKGTYEGLYCVGCEEYKTEKDLVNGVCPDHLTPPEQVKEDNYFFKLTAFEAKLKEWFDAHPNFVSPDFRMKEMRELLNDGLEDISISREKSKLSWGVPVPDDEDHVMYVWFDALTNYVSAIGFGTDEAEFAKWWPANMHVIGKGINRFHSLLWPAMLMSAGLELPQQVVVHGYITVEGQKMSKTLGNVIDPIELVEKYGTEPVRYFLLSEIPFAADGDFSFDRFHVRYESELANGLGNLLSRVTNMVEKYFDGVVVATDHEGWELEAVVERWKNAVGTLQFHEALDMIFKEIITPANVYIEQHQPWALAKTDQAALKKVLEQLVYALQQLPDVLSPFIPETAAKIRASVTTGKITKSAPLFPRIQK